MEAGDAARRQPRLRRREIPTFEVLAVAVAQRRGEPGNVANDPRDVGDLAVDDERGDAVLAATLRVELADLEPDQRGARLQADHREKLYRRRPHRDHLIAGDDGGDDGREEGRK